MLLDSDRVPSGSLNNSDRVISGSLNNCSKYFSGSGMTSLLSRAFFYLFVVDFFHTFSVGFSFPVPLFMNPLFRVHTVLS